MRERRGVITERSEESRFSFVGVWRNVRSFGRCAPTRMTVTVGTVTRENSTNSPQNNKYCSNNQATTINRSSAGWVKKKNWQAFACQFLWIKIP